MTTGADAMNILRLYIDTSVVGGCHDPEFTKPSRDVFSFARSRKAVLLISDLLVDELRLAPVEVQQELRDLPSWAMEPISVSVEAIALKDAYLAAGVVSHGHTNDALHVALATVTRADTIVSWNFKHIVHLEKIRGFNAVNLREGYLPIEIRSPLEVV